MILRRITEHFKTQNWFAIGLELGIVVLGVYLGLQAQQWADNRETRHREAGYLDRLHEEVTLVEDLRENLVSERLANRSSLESAYRKLFIDTKASGFSAEECVALAEASQLSNPTADLPTLGELLSAGQLGAIRSQSVRLSLMRFVQKSARSAHALESMNREVVNLYQKYPALIEVRGGPGSGENWSFNFDAKCNVSEMRGNGAFLNDFVDSNMRYAAYTEVVVKMISEELRLLHVVLDQELSVNHD